MLEGRDRPTALIAANDMLCFGAYSAAMIADFRSRRFSVTGDDISMAPLMMPPSPVFVSRRMMAKGGVGLSP